MLGNCMDLGASKFSNFQTPFARPLHTWVISTEKIPRSGPPPLWLFTSGAQVPPLAMALFCAEQSHTTPGLFQKYVCLFLGILSSLAKLEPLIWLKSNLEQTVSFCVLKNVRHSFLDQTILKSLKAHQKMKRKLVPFNIKKGNWMGRFYGQNHFNLSDGSHI